MQLTQPQLDVVYPKSGAPVLLDRMSWARSYMRTAKLVESAGRGVWVLTDAGRHAADLSAPQVKRLVADAYNEELTAKRKLQAEQITSSTPDADPSGAPLDWSDQLLTSLREMEPAAF